MPLDPPTPGSPEDWLRHARSDLALAQQWQVPDVLLATLCFHAQQALAGNRLDDQVERLAHQRSGYDAADTQRAA